MDDFGRRYYSALGIDRGDMAARARQTGRNFVFFEAPVGLIFTIHATLTKHSWLDQGLFLQNLMLAARSRLGNVPPGFIRAFPGNYRRAARTRFRRIGDMRNVVGLCGRGGIGQSLNMPREPVQGFTRWLGFDE